MINISLNRKRKSPIPARKLGFITEDCSNIIAKVIKCYCNNFQYSLSGTRLRKHYHPIPCTITGRTPTSGVAYAELDFAAGRDLYPSSSAVCRCTSPLGTTLLECTGCVGPSYIHSFADITCTEIYYTTH